MSNIKIGALALLLGVSASAQTPVVNAGGIVNSGSYSTGGVAPGSIVSIFGTNLASGLAEATSVPLPTSLGNVKSVTFGGVEAGLYFVSATQINAQVPWDSSGNVAVVVTTTGGSSSAQNVSVVSAMPGIFTISANGLGSGIATDNTDGSVATATVAGVLSHPIAIGSYLVVWCTGLGAVDGKIADGANAGGATVNTMARPTVLIGGVPATFVYSVLSPQYVGLYQIGVQVASNTPTGTSIPIQIQVNGVTTSSKITIAVAPPVAAATSNTCTLSSTSCSGIVINGDPPSDGAFAGYADPSIRQDPLTGTLWMAYSYLYTITTGVQGIDIHVADSTDGGKSWNYVGTLYKSQQVTDPVTNATAYERHEVMNLLPEVINGVTNWYGIHSVYLVPDGGNGAQISYTKRWEIAFAPGTADTGPMGLTNANPEYLGQSIDTYPQYYPVSTNLSELNSQLNACELFYEPALILSNNSLYLFLSCQPANGTTDMFYAVFGTADPQDHAGDWEWSYIPQGSNKFANASDAASAGSNVGSGATYITQMDLAPGKNPGQIMAIFTVAYNGANGKVSLGCMAAELAGIAPPSFIHNAQGQVQVDAYIKSPDSEPGPGSCTYSPYSDTGLIMAHLQQKNAPQNGEFYSFLMQSGLLP